MDFINKAASEAQETVEVGDNCVCRTAPHSGLCYCSELLHYDSITMFSENQRVFSVP